MKFDLKSDVGRAMLALDRVGGDALTTALRMGYAAAARVVRDKAKVTTAFSDRSGTARRSWRISQSRQPFNHAKVVNTAFYSMFLERAPLNSGFLTRAAESTTPEQINAVRKAVVRHLEKLRAAPK